MIHVNLGIEEYTEEEKERIQNRHNEMTRKEGK